MFNRKPALTSVGGGRDEQSSHPDPGTKKVFQVGFGQISKIALTICSDRVKRTLFLYDPRSREPEGFSRIRLPDGGLPDSREYSPEESEVLIAHWAREDVDRYLDCEPLLHAHPESDSGDGVQIRVRQTVHTPQTTGVPEQPATSAAPAPAGREAPQPARPAPEKVPVPEEENIPNPLKNAKEKASGVVRFAGIRPHSNGNRSFECFAVDLRTADGSIKTFRGTVLEDRIRALGIVAGERATIGFLGKEGKKNLFHVTRD
jgi:hypothetical protein